MSNTSRAQILSAIRANIPPGRVEHPQIPVFKNADTNLKATFERHLEEAGGAAHNIESGTDAQAKLASLHPAAQVICSAVPEIPGTRRAETVRDPHQLADVDVGVLRAQFGVAESGAVWLTEEDLMVSGLGGSFPNISWFCSIPTKSSLTCTRLTHACVSIGQPTGAS